MNLSRKVKQDITSIGIQSTVRLMMTLHNISNLIIGTTIESTLTWKQERCTTVTIQKNMEILTMMVMAITFTTRNMATMNTPCWKELEPMKKCGS